MENPRNVPGTRHIKNSLVDLKAEIQKIIKNIKDLTDKIEETKRNDAKNSPKAPLISQKRSLSNEVKDLRAGRKEIFDQMKEIEAVYGDLSSKKEDNKGFMSTDSIDKRLSEINLEVMKFPHSSQKSKEIEDEIKQLKTKKLNIETEQKKHEAMKKVQDKFYTLKASVRYFNKQINEKNCELQEVNKSLDELDSQEVVVNPAIENYKKSIEALEIKKDEINKKINLLREELTQKKKDFDEFLKVKATQEAYEKQKKTILDKIAQLEESKSAYVTERDNCDSSKFDSVVFDLNKYKSEKEKNVSFPINLVLSLTKFKVKIPSTSSQIPTTVSELEIKKKEFLNTMTVRIQELERKIAEVDDLIQQEKNTIAGIPVVEVKLPPFMTKSRSK